MSSQALGKNTSVVEVTNISKHGIWLLTREKELFIPYEEFPWFKDATIHPCLFQTLLKNSCSSFITATLASKEISSSKMNSSKKIIL